jgi:ketosteroid isomerase-like protein
MVDRKLVVGLLSAAAAIGAVACKRRKGEPKLEEAEIRRRIDALVVAVRAADLERVMSFYAPDLVTFDIVPPLRKIGADGKRQNWADVFAIYQQPLGYEIRDLTIAVDGDVAFGYSLNRISGRLKSGTRQTRTDQWVRWTTCWRKVGGKWVIAHDHVSVPADFRTGKALVDLAP